MWVGDGGGGRVLKGSYQSFVFTGQLHIPLLLGNQDTYHLETANIYLFISWKNHAINTLM